MKKDLQNKLEFTIDLTFLDPKFIRRFAGENYKMTHVPKAAKQLLSWHIAKSPYYELIQDLDNE